MANPIVVGVDGSDRSIAAVRRAAADATLRGAPLVVLHAWHVPSIGLPGLAAPYPDAEFKAYAEQVIDHVLAAAGHIGAPVERRTIKGNAAQALIDASGDADLVVVGSHGHGGPELAPLWRSLPLRQAVSRHWA